MIDDFELVADRPPADIAPRPNALAWALAGLLLVTVFAVDPAGFVPTGPLRSTAMTLATFLALAALVRRPVALPRPMITVWIALIAVLFVATLTAADPLHAWIGTPDRRLGLLAWLGFPIVFVAGYACTTRAATRLLTRTASLGAVGLGVWSTAELLGHAPFGLEFADARAGGPFGQPAYLGAACLLFGPLAAAVAFDRVEIRSWRRIGACGGFGTLVALAASQTRAAWLGALVAAIAVAIRARPWLRRHAGAAAAMAGALTAIVLVLAVATPLGPRAASVFDFDHGTSAGRLDEWRIAAHAIVDRPVLGAGPEGYRVVFPQAVDAAYVRKYGVAVYPDRAHNGMLDVTVVGGVLAGLLYAFLCVLVVRVAWRAIGRRDPLDLALGAAVIAYVVQQQFLFPLAELDPIVWMLVGMLVARDSAVTRASVARVRWAVLPIAVVAVAASTFGARDVLADRALRRAATANDYRTGLRDADIAARLRPDSIRAWYVAARIAQRGDALTDVDAALDRVLQGLHRSPKDPALRDLYGDLLVERAQRSRLPEDIALARRELARLTRAAPHDPKLANAQVRAHSIRQLGKP